NGQVGGPAAVHEPRAVIFVRIENAVTVDVIAEKKLGRHSLDEQQLFQRVKRAVLGGVRGTQAAVVVAFGAIGPRLVIRVEPVNDRVGYVVGHVRQAHEQVVKDLAAAI